MQTTKPRSAKGPTKHPMLERLGWISAILGFLILVQLSYFPHIFNKSYWVSKTDSTQLKKPDSLKKINSDTAHRVVIFKHRVKRNENKMPSPPQPLQFRFLTPADTAQLLSIIPSSECIIDIYYPLGIDVQYASDALELNNYLKEYFENVNLHYLSMSGDGLHIYPPIIIGNKLKVFVDKIDSSTSCNIQIRILSTKRG